VNTKQKNLRFLIVDDFSTMRRIVRSLLKEIGFLEADESEDGQSALKRLHSGQFDIVITDINMPNMNGMELLEAMQADEKLKSIPVIMITAEARREDVLRAAQAGAAAYIVKPFSKGTLEDKISKILKKKVGP
jgi:two-component system chemotaxis response regulator CheY